jgi:hypothetical protein
MKIEVKMDSPSKIVKRIGLDQDGKIQKFWTATVLRRIQRYMPYRTGETIKLTIAQTNINKPEIVTDTPYARMLYYGVSAKGRPLNYTKTKNPKAGPYWDRALTAAEMPAMAKELQSYIDRG